MNAESVLLADALFEGVLQNPPWTAFLKELERALSSRGSTIVLRMPRKGCPGTVVTTSGTETSLATFQSQPFGPNFLQALPPNKVHFLRELYSPEELKRERYYSEYLNEFGVFDLACVNVYDQETGVAFRLRTSRLHGEPTFGEREREVLQGLLPRLPTALSLYSRLAVQQLELKLHEDLVNKLEIGCVMVGAPGYVLKTNAVASRLLEEQDGLFLYNREIRCSNKKSGDPLQTAIHGLLEKMKSGIAVADVALKVPRSKPELGYLSLLCRPLVGRSIVDGGGLPSVLVLVRKSHRIDASPALLKRHFNFTNAEANLALKLLNERTLSQAAGDLGISPFTARVHLSAMFSKAGCHRQSQLITQIQNTISSLWPVDTEADVALRIEKLERVLM